MAETTLNIKQEKFCLEYSKSGNATQAYKLAGYNVKDDNSAAAAAQQLLRNIKIQGRLRELSAEVKNSKIANVAECQEILSEIARNKKTYAKDRVAALNVLLKAQGAFTQNVNFNGALPVMFYGEDKIPD